MDPTVLVAGIAALASIASACIAAYTGRRVGPKVEETHRQVTSNHHVSSPPTILDQLDHLTLSQASLHRELRGMADKLDHHIDWHMERPQ